MKHAWKRREAASRTRETEKAAFAGARARGKSGQKRAVPVSFAQKMALSMMLVLALALSVGGAALLAGNFRDQLREAADAAEAQHLLQCYALESTLRDASAQGESPTDAQLLRFGTGLADYTGGRLAALFWQNDARAVYSSFPWEQTPMGSGETYRMHRENNDRTYMLFETQVEAPGASAVLLLTGHDVTSLFAARDRALIRFYEMELIVLLCAGAAIALLSRWLTRPLARLTRASESVAAGAYDMRTDIASGDEIGALSRSFDTMAAAVEEKIAALELSVRQREDFMAAFTHELKTPMTTVIGYADTLRSIRCSPQEQRAAAGYIFSEAKRLETLSEKLLQLLGLREGAPALRPVALDDVFDAAETALAPAFAPALTLDIRRAPGVEVYGDLSLLTDLLYNLAQNAARAKPKDGCVHIGWRARGEDVEIAVRDTGCGIPAELIARVTEPFFMVDKSRARAGGGSGVGLALCEKIAELHGGPLAIQSALGEGTEAAFRLSTKPPETALPDRVNA